MWIDLEGFMLSELSQTGKENYIFFFTFIWNLFVYFHSYEVSKKKKNSKKWTQRYREQTVARGEGGRRGEKGEGD